MAYADQKMSGNKLAALIIVAILHVFVGYALVTGLAYEAVQKVKETVSAVNIEEPPPPPDEPPPPPPPDQPQAPPPIVAPPPPISFERPAPQLDVVQTPPKIVVPVTRVAAPPAPPAPPPAPPPPRFTAKGASPKGNPGNWATTDDYPSRALREEREGTTRFRVTVDANGRVSDCQITGSSGSPDLDEAACKNISRRARFEPATNGEGQPTTGSYSNAIRWVIPK